MPVRSILEELLRGRISLEEAERAIESAQLSLGDRVRFDIFREKRTGFPEAVFAPGKSDEDIVNIVKAVGDVLVTRLPPDRAEGILKELGDIDRRIEYHETARVLAVRSKDPEFIGMIGLLSAGTSDIPVAEEARVVAEESGCEVITAYDVGVAGLHRLMDPLRRMHESGVKAIIVVAGMEGALPSVVAGLVDVPVIGVPTSVGYGVGEGGSVALNSMLQSCSPGIGVVNIDNGFGAAVLAVKILRTCSL
ncbi:MAG: nickel pincer cofactor biosynthesis protein LarB [Methanothermobacter sp.]|nr:nickel pincer cofactor biosynthesis protein LarB [Methanothermobacter sp.]